jgi:2-dehydro-3-deoxygluconokinase
MVSGRLVTCGEAMAVLASATVGPLRTAGSLRLSVAGAESNVAIGVARLGHPVTWIGRVGDDELGELVLRTLRAEGVDVSAVGREPDAPTGLMIKERRVGAVTRVHYYRSGSAGARLSAGDIDNEVLAGAGIVHVTGITPALGGGPAAAVEALVAAARRRGVPVAVDVNYRERLWPSRATAAATLNRLARGADYVVAGRDELALISGAAEGAAAQELLAAGARAVVVSHGEDGAAAWTADGMVHRPAVAVAAVDTVGAGDGLCAGFLSGVLDGLEPAAALERGVKTAAFAVAADGDWEGLPRRDELALVALDRGATVR